MIVSPWTHISRSAFGRIILNNVISNKVIIRGDGQHYQFRYIEQRNSYVRAETFR